MDKHEQKVSYKVVRVRDAGVSAFIITAEGDLHCVETLPRARDVIDHSADFGCGDNGSASAQLALAILCHAAGVDVGIKLHQKFKRAVISKLGGEDSPGFVWEMSRESVVKTAGEIDSLGVEGYTKRFSKYRPFSADNIGKSAFRHK